MAKSAVYRISYSGYRPEIIQRAIWLYVRFTLSFRDVEDSLAERGIIVSYKRAALKLMRKLLKEYAFVPDKLVTDDLRSYAAGPRSGIASAERMIEAGRQLAEDLGEPAQKIKAILVGLQYRVDVGIERIDVNFPRSRLAQLLDNDRSQDATSRASAHTRRSPDALIARRAQARRPPNAHAGRRRCRRGGA